MTDPVGEVDLIRVVLADANVLYSRVLRDYLLYAADQEIIAITWSEQILAEVIEHLEQNVAGFDLTRLLVGSWFLPSISLSFALRLTTRAG